MQKILGLLLVTSSMFSMRLDLVNSPNKVNIFRKKLLKHMDNLSKVYIKSAPVFTFQELESSKVRIEQRSVFVPHQLGLVELYHDKKGFSVIQNDKKYEIQKCFIDPMLRNIEKEDLKSFLKVGYFSLNQMSDGEFSLKATRRLKGGGPYVGGFMYWLTKSLCYGGLAAAAGTTVVVTGGAIVGAVAGGAGTVTALAIAGNTASGAILTTAATTTIGTTIVTTAGVGVGTAATAGAITFGSGAVMTAAGTTTAGAVITKAAVVTTGAVIASGASTGGVIAGIEALSIAVGTFFGMLPTP